MKLWIARDKDGDLYLYTRKPEKVEEYWTVEWPHAYYQFNTDLFPEVKWEDDEPTEVELKIVKKE